MCFAFNKEKGKDMEIADAINDVAEDLALVHYDKPLAELEEHERKEIILIAENEVLGIWYAQRWQRNNDKRIISIRTT